MLVPSTANSGQLVGTAYDYWFRSWMKKRYPLITRQPDQWVAERVMTFPMYLEPTPGIEVIHERVRNIRNLADAYEAGDHKALPEFLRGCLVLANLDVAYRSSCDVADPLAVNSADFGDLQALIELTKERSYLFCPRERVVLNPDFGVMSWVAGGADADLVLDDMLLDLKVKKSAKTPGVEFQYQLFGYWLLAAMEGELWPINRVGVYLARDGALFTIPVSEWTRRVDILDFAKKFCSIVGALPGASFSGDKLTDLLRPRFERLAANLRELVGT